MAHMKRTHKVDIRALHERFSCNDFKIVYINTEFQCADVHTKFITCKETWKRTLVNLGVFKPELIWNKTVNVGSEHSNVTKTSNNAVDDKSMVVTNTGSTRVFCAYDRCNMANTTGVLGDFCSQFCSNQHRLCSSGLGETSNTSLATDTANISTSPLPFVSSSGPIPSRAKRTRRKRSQHPAVALLAAHLAVATAAAGYCDTNSVASPPQDS